jgi:hypothetical protein
MKEKFNGMTRKNVLKTLTALFIITLFASFNMLAVTNIEHIFAEKTELKTNVNIEEIWDSSKMVKQNISNSKLSGDNNSSNKQTIDLKNNDKDKADDKDKKENKSTEENKTEAKEKVEIMPETSKTRLLGLRDSSLKTLEKYRNEYRNSIIYGTIAYILHMLSLISIPILVILLIVSYVYDSVIGLKTRSLYNKGRLIRFHVLTFFVACQLMPLIFATVIKGWGN